MTKDTPDTRSRLLDAAEELFAERGWAGASMRELTARAGANLAAVGYHFGGKEELFREVVLRRIREVNEARLARLTDLERGPSPPALDALLEAFVDPVLESARGPRGEPFLRLVGRTHGDPDGPWRAVVERAPFAEVLERYGAALGAARPDLSPADVTWRLHLMVGALVHMLLHGRSMCDASGSTSTLEDASALRAQLLAFLHGAFSAPPAAPQPGTSLAAARPDAPPR